VLPIEKIPVEFKPKNTNARCLFNRKNSNQVLKGVSMTIPGGKKIGICGRTGRYGDKALLISRKKANKSKQWQELSNFNTFSDT